MSDMAEPISVTTPPASVQAEEALLGSYLTTPDLLQTVVVNPKDFYVTRNRWIYEALSETEHSGSQVDFLTVCDALEKNGKLAQAGGAAYLMGLVTQCPSSLHADSYARTIRDRAQRRRMLEIAGDLAKSAYDLTEDVDQAISKTAANLANSARPKGGAQHVSIFASRHFDRIDQLSRGERIVQRIPTGFIDFDKCLGGGIRIPEMLLLLGKPGLGKTKFILQLGFNMGQHMPGVIYEMETDEDQIMDREISRRTGISDSRLETGKLVDTDWPLYTEAIERLSDTGQTKVYLDFGSNWTTTSLRADLARLKAEYDIKWYMVDYMKFLRDPYGKDEIERLNHISGRLKQINRELDLASVVIHSMNKEGLKSQKPDLSNMSQGADIAFDTDKALFMMPHVPVHGEPIENYRTFVFQKSRSRLNDLIFHLEAVKEIPLFRDVATPEQAAHEPSARKSQPTARKPYAEYEMNGVRDGDLEF